MKFQVDHAGTITITGVINKASPIVLNNTGTGELLKIANSGTNKVIIGNSGHGDFHLGGLQTAVVTSDPDGARAGAPGDMVLWDDSSGATGSYWWCVCTASPTTWKKVQVK